MLALSAVAIACTLVVAGVVYDLTVRSSAVPESVADGPSFYQALADLNGSVDNRTGGPWSLFSVIGLAAQGDFSPNVKGYYTLNLSVNACQLDFNGLTLWNGSIPSFHGSFNSGTAPFWQLAYYSNSTNEVLIATAASGVFRVYSPIPLSNNCTLSWTDFRINPSFWAQQIEQNSSLPVNTPLAAQTVWGELDTGWITRNAPLVEVLTLGPAIFEGTQDIQGGSWGVDFIGCGFAGITGVRPLISSGTDRNGQWAGSLNGSTNCAVTETDPQLATPLAYQLLFANVTQSGTPETTWIQVPFQVALAFPNGSLTGDYDGWGLANWMVRFNLSLPDGELLPLGSSGCSGWVSSVTDCLANESGWYIVLLSAGGGWLASFGETSNGPAWDVPVTAVVSHQQLVVVVPSGWPTSGLRLNATSTTSFSMLTGSSTF